MARHHARLLEVRLREHKTDVHEGNVETSAVAEHVWLKEQLDFQNCSVIVQEIDLHRCLFLKSWLIQRNATMNRLAHSPLCTTLCVTVNACDYMY